MSSLSPVKLYYRIGEVANIVGVEPHVLRYWETEFRTIRPEKSRRGQRVYSRKDVERLLRVKELLYGQGYTIAGARRQLREPGAPLPGQLEREQNKTLRDELGSLREEIASELALLDAPAESPVEVPRRAAGRAHRAQFTGV